MTSSFHKYRAAQARRISASREAARRKRLTTLISGATTLADIVYKQGAYKAGVAEAMADAAITSAQNALALLQTTRQAEAAIGEAISSVERTQASYKGIRTTLSSGIEFNSATAGRIASITGAQKQAAWFGVAQDDILQAKAAASTAQLASLRNKEIGTLVGDFADRRTVLGGNTPQEQLLNAG